ncbi:MAG: DUF6062 family protein [Saccharofermentans sp.]|nr:DUF6062 family protein [Saccharofermentans sp.]
METIYTIPVNDAYNAESECPLCLLRKKAEDNELDYYLGPSLMEPDTRKVTNKTGFCPDHMAKLNKRVTNRLGLALVIHTHLLDYDEDITEELLEAAPAKAGLIRGRSSDYKAVLKDLADRIDKRTASCPVCDKMNKTIERYNEVIMHMFSHDAGFKQKFLNTKSHCLPHTAALLRTAASKLSQNDAADFVTALAEGSNSYFKELEKDVEWFTQKFDYRNKDKSWGNSKNAIQRSMRFLSSDRGDFNEG